jgi:hypothetical protein
VIAHRLMRERGKVERGAIHAREHTT